MSNDLRRILSFISAGRVTLSQRPGGDDGLVANGFETAAPTAVVLLRQWKFRSSRSWGWGVFFFWGSLLTVPRGSGRGMNWRARLRRRAAGAEAAAADRSAVTDLSLRVLALGTASATGYGRWTSSGTLTASQRRRPTIAESRSRSMKDDRRKAQERVPLILLRRQPPAAEQKEHDRPGACTSSGGRASAGKGLLVGGSDA